MMYLSESENMIKEPHMSVSGTGVVKTLPDLFSVTFSVMYEGIDDDEIFQKVTKDAEKLMKALKAWADEWDRIESTSFSLEHYLYDKKNGIWKYNQVIARGSVHISVTTHRLDEANQLIKLGKKSGAVEISSVYYSLSDKLKRRQSEIALENAVRAARQDAEVTAAAFGIRLSHMISIKVRNYADMVSGDDDYYMLENCRKIDDDGMRYPGSGHNHRQGFLEPGYITTEASIDAIYGIGEL